MSQEPSDNRALLWGLQGVAVESVETLSEAPDSAAPPIKVVHLINRTDRHVCPDCGKSFTEGLFEEFNRTRFRDCSLGDRVTHVEIRAMRIACCGGTRVEQFPFAMPGFRMTRRFFERVAALCTRIPIRTVAELVDLSWDTVARVDKKAIELGLGERILDLNSLRWIGVDEVSRTGGHVYFTIVTDLVKGQVIWIGDGKGERGFKPFLDLLGKKRRRRIRGVVSDLGYQAAIANGLPEAIHVLDRFHIVLWANEAISQLRRRIFSASPPDELGRELKGKKWVLLSAREALDKKGRQLLEELAGANEELYHAYLLKERLRGILRHPWKHAAVLRARVKEWIEMAREAGIREFCRVASRLEPHVEAVVAGHQFNLKMGLVEAINGKIAMLRRQARGYRDPEYFKLKILQRCGMPDNPWARITL